MSAARAEHVVRLHEVVKGEVVGDKQPRVYLVILDQAKQCRGRIGIDEARRDRDVADPQILQMQSHRFAMDADVGDIATGTNKTGGQLEGIGHSDRLDGHIGAETSVSSRI